MNSKRTARRVAASAAVALLLASACGGNDDDAVSEAVEVAAVQISGQPLGPLGESSDPALGQPIPGLAGTAIDGSPLAWTPGERPAAIVFLAHWCPACQAEVAELADWLDAGNQLPEGVDVISVVTLAEIERGLARQKRGNPAFARDLEAWMDQLAASFADRIIDVDPAAARLWGRMSGDIGHFNVDLLIAATALVHGFTVVTRNVRHFKPTGVRLLNPFGDNDPGSSPEGG